MIGQEMVRAHLLFDLSGIDAGGFIRRSSIAVPESRPDSFGREAASQGKPRRWFDKRDMTGRAFAYPEQIGAGVFGAMANIVLDKFTNMEKLDIVKTEQPG